MIHKRLRFYSLRTRLYLMAIVVVFFPMLLTTVTAFLAQKDQIDQSLKRELNSSLNACFLYLSKAREKLDLTTLAVAGDNTCKTTLRLGVTYQLKKQLEILAEKYDMDFLIVVDRQGQVVAANQDAFTHADFSRHPLLIEALEGRRQTVFTQEENPALIQNSESAAASSILAIESAMAITVRDEKIGAVLAGLVLSKNSAFMTAMRQAGTTDRAALVMNGTVVAASFNREKFCSDHLIEVLSQEKGKKPAKASAISVITSPQDGKKRVIQYRDIPDFSGGTAATLVSILDYSSTQHLIKSALTRIAVVFISGMSLALLIAFFIARSVSAPVKALSEAMQTITIGQFTQINSPHGGKDEIGTLVDGFNSMTMQLKSRMQDLHTEISERHRVEQSLSEEKERLAVTLRSIGEAVIASDVDGKIVFINKVAEELTGWQNNDAQGLPSRNVLRIVEGKTFSPLPSPVEKVLQVEHKVEEIHSRVLISRSGSSFSVAYSGAPMLDQNGGIIGAVVVFRDLSLEQKMESELLKIKKLESIGVLAGGIAHDFNNILSAILGNIELALKQVGGTDQKMSRLLGNAQKAVRRAVGLTQQLLTFSKGGEPIRESTELPALIRDSADFVLSGSQVSCRYEFAPDLWMADADSGQLSQVIQNIIINAKHAMPEGGLITIRAANHADSEGLNLNASERVPYVAIAISDTGTGIPAEIVDRIFDPYFTTKQTGNGLGLAICHSIVTKHSGFMTVNSTPDQGTTFNIYLPAIVEKSPAKKLYRRAAEKPRRHLKVLVLDDEKDVLDIVSAQLEELGHEAIPAQNGNEALLLYRQFESRDRPVDIVIMDLTIPAGMGGKEAAQLLLRHDPGALIIVSSGYSNDPIMANYRDHGFHAALAKPFDLGLLEKTLNDVLTDEG